MPRATFEKFLPVAGIIAGVLFLAGFPLSKLPANPADPGGFATIDQHQGVNLLAGITAGLCAVMLLYFVTGVRLALRSREAEESTYSAAAFAGGILLAAALALDSCLRVTMTDAVSKGDHTSTTTLGWLESDLWVFFSIAASVFLVSTGLGGLRTAMLPKWLAVISVVLGVLSVLGPAGFVTFFAFAFWLVAVGVVLIRLPRDPASRHPTSPEDVELPSHS